MVAARSVVRSVIGPAAIFIALTSCGQAIRLGDGPAGISGAATDAADTGSFEAGSLEAGSMEGAASPDGGACPHGQVKANEVLWIGDTWIEIPGIQHDRVRDLARAAGAIAPDEDYVDVAAPSTTMAAIANQYKTREAGATKVKVLLMNGGTWDTIVGNGSAASVSASVTAFQQLLTQLASDGTVEHVVYFLNPELPTIPGVAALRPGYQQACANSTVPCHFLDLQPLWAGHPEYTDGSGIQASVAGGTVIANAIWAIMQENCIAQ